MPDLLSQTTTRVGRRVEYDTARTYAEEWTNAEGHDQKTEYEMYNHEDQFKEIRRTRAQSEVQMRAQW
jgi:hypothetical protein